MDYIVIIPARNEENRLPCVIDSIIHQSIQPKILLIIDDGSTDRTARIIDAFENRFPWIHHIKTEHRDRETWSLSHANISHFASILQQGICVAREICDEHGLTYNYIAKVDADFILPTLYFEDIFKEFKKDTMLGIASGDVYQIEMKKQSMRETHQKILPDNPTDGARVYRKECFEAIGGIPIVGGPDGAALAIARTMCWKTLRIPNIKVFSTRKPIGGGAAWKGHLLAGYCAYTQDYHPILIILNAILLSFSKPYYHSLGWLWGYTFAAIRKLPKVNDQRIRLYYRKQRLSELARIILRKQI